jgi:dihydropteroate synthase
MTQLVGILNITPDSFSDGGLFTDTQSAVGQARQLFSDGAAIVDIGAESTRPGAKALSAEEEWQRLEPVLAELIKLFPGKLSVDTYHADTAEKVLNLDDVIINDVTGLNDPIMVEIIAAHSARCVIGHLPGYDIQTAHRDVLISDAGQVKKDLLASAALLGAKGLPKSKIILDPGIGFGKTPELNRELLKFASQVPDYPVMVGYSRKRFLGDARLKLEANLEAGRAAVKAGAAYLRVHDVAGHRPLLY